MFSNIFGSCLGVGLNQENCALRNDQMMAMQRFNARCVRNFEEFHGVKVHPEMNMVALHRLYDMPWRKTRIPKTSRR